VAKREGDGDDAFERLRSRDKRIGQFILWAVMALLGWIFLTTLYLDKEIPVIKQRLSTNESEINKIRTFLENHRHNHVGPVRPNGNH
jgi:hypothetical protein